MTKVKICGMRREGDARMANELLPDYIGMVINVPSSFRSVTPDQARPLSRLFDSRISKVGVFIDEDIRIVLSLLGEKVIDIAQLHGREDDEYILRLQERGFPVIKAFCAEDAGKALYSPADYVLIDGSYPGSGQGFDWERLIGFPRPFFLAGGIDSGNAARAIELLSPFAIDSASGTETDGCKDHGKMKRLLEAAGRIYG